MVFAVNTTVIFKAYELDSATAHTTVQTCSKHDIHAPFFRNEQTTSKNRFKQEANLLTFLINREMAPMPKPVKRSDSPSHNEDVCDTNTVDTDDGRSRIDVVTDIYSKRTQDTYTHQFLHVVFFS